MNKRLLESSAKAMLEHNENQRSNAKARLAKVAAQKRQKKQDKA